MRLSITVLIPTYNGSRTLTETLDSVFSQTRPPDEILIVDDGSTDETVNLVKSYGSRLRLLQQANSGVGGARSLGFREARSDWVALLDQDDLFLPDKLKIQERLIQENPSLVLAYSGHRIRFSNGVVQDVAAFPAGELWPALRYRSPVVPCTALLRRMSVLEVGNFSSSLRMCDDWDMWVRLVSRFSAAQCGAVAEPLSVYRIWEGNHSRNVRRTLAEQETLVETLLTGLRGWERFKLRQQIRARFYAEASVALRELDDQDYLEFMRRSLTSWPMPGGVLPPARYRTAAVMLLQGLGIYRTSPFRPKCG